MVELPVSVEVGAVEYDVALHAYDGLVSEETPFRDDLSLILPSYMDPPYSEASETGVAITLYEFPSLGGNSK